VETGYTGFWEVVYTLPIREGFGKVYHPRKFITFVDKMVHFDAFQCTVFDFKRIFLHNTNHKKGRQRA